MLNAISRAMVIACGVPAGWGLAAGGTDLAASRSVTRPTSQSTARFSAARVSELVEQLGDRQWSVRERATVALKGGGPELLDPLARGYRARKASEIRLRIKAIVEHLVMVADGGQSGGFLGVRQRLITRTDDARIPQGRSGVLVVEVLPNTAAAEAGMARGDVILALDGQGLKADQTAVAFGKRVYALRPGTKVKLTVLRGHREREILATLKSRPPEYADQRSLEFNRAQRRFGALWRAKFDPNDRQVGVSGPRKTKRGPRLEGLRPVE